MNQPTDIRTCNSYLFGFKFSRRSAILTIEEEFTFDCESEPISGERICDLRKLSLDWTLRGEIVGIVPLSDMLKSVGKLIYRKWFLRDKSRNDVLKLILQ